VRLIILLLMGIAGGSGLSGCTSDVTGLSEPEQALSFVRMNVSAVTLATAPGANTVQLSATAYRGTGEPIADVVPTYTVSDNTLHVTPEGLVTGVKFTTKSYVVGHVTHGGVTHTDTTWVSVVNAVTPAPLTTFAITFAPALAAGSTERIVVTAVDANGVDRSLVVPVAFETSDARIANIDRYGDLKALTPERTVTVYAKAMVYGVSYTDSLSVEVVYPLSGTVLVVPRRTITGAVVLEFSPKTLQLSAGAFVTFCNCSGGLVPNRQPIDVVFDSPDAAHPFPNPLYPTGAGNIPPFMRTDENPFAVFQARLFPDPGTYRFRSTLYESTGTLIIR
jgi:hypothetical protein